VQPAFRNAVEALYLGCFHEKARPAASAAQVAQQSYEVSYGQAGSEIEMGRTGTGAGGRDSD
jgi:hypothetical protein